eukprot:TRINITY_DN9341_c0_g2_i1.p1 TRINITY_DN9341_c0_g2~~TRINITY_DN9341_c0_g2_i1.p1  ORF type:complete len:779 (+),score=293.22 TRINITY_DN9341_c0_g2_i1:73-2409(+)
MEFSKEAVVLVWDVGSSMLRRGTAVEQCRRCVSSLLLRKLQYCKQDEVGVVLFGTNGTHNVLNRETGGYENITVLLPIARPTVDSVRAVEKARADGHSKADMLDALIIAADMLHRRVGKLRFGRRIFLITDAGGEVKKKDHLSNLKDSLDSQGIGLVVVSVAFRFDTHREAEEASWEDCDMRAQNEKVLHWLCDELKRDCVVAPIARAVAQSEGMQSASVLQRSAFRAVLSCGQGEDAFSLPIHAYLQTRPAVIPQLRRISAKAKALLPAGVPVGPEDCKVEIERRYFRSLDDEDEVEEKDRCRAYSYGQTSVPFSEIDEEWLKFGSGGGRSMQVLCFVPSGSIPRHWLLSPTYCLVTPPHDTAAAEALRALLYTLYETDDAMVLRLVRSDKAQPVVCVARAHIKPSRECLLLSELPFAEDVRGWEFPSLSGPNAKDVPKETQKAAEDLVLGMDLMTALDGEEAVKPRETFNPVLQNFHQAVRKRLLHPGAALPALDDRARRTSCLWAREDNVLSGFFGRHEAAVEHFRSSAKVHLREEKKGESSWKTFWYEHGKKRKADPLEPGPGPSPGGLRSPKRARPDRYFHGSQGGYSTTPGGSLGTSGGVTSGMPGTDGDLLDVLQRPKASQVGTVCPVQDFKEMLGRRDADYVPKALDGLAKVTKQLVRESIGDQMYSKAMGCVVALRVGCVRENDAAFFNDFIRSFKEELVALDRKNFWTEHIVAQGITLVTDSEVDAGGAKLPTVEEAKRFLDGDVGLERKPSLLPPAPEEDDLFGGLE